MKVRELKELVKNIPNKLDDTEVIIYDDEGDTIEIGSLELHDEWGGSKYISFIHGAHWRLS